MIYTTTLTQKGQVTVPVEIRQWLKLKPYEKVAFLKNDGQVVIQRAEGFRGLKGTLKSARRFDDKKADKAVMDFIGKEYEKKLSRS